MKNPTINNQFRAASAAAAIAQKDSGNDVASEISAALSSRFEPLELVGASQSAFYFLGCDLLARTPQQLVKVKIYARQATDDQKQLELFRLEAGSAARLSHRNILRAGPPENINGIHFSVIEHRTGTESLGHGLDRKGWLDLKLAVGIARQVADALEYAHRLGVLHLKINPENILLDQDGAAIVADFGLGAGNNFEWAHKERVRHNDPRYLSPELIAGKAVDLRSDLYSLGLVLYKMLTDRLPFDSEDTDNIRRKHINQAPLPPHLYRPDIPLRLSAVITCLLEKDPSRRYGSAGALCSALDYFIGSHFGAIEQSHKQFHPAPSDNQKDCATTATCSPDETSASDSSEKPSAFVSEQPASKGAFIESKAVQVRAIEPPKRRIEKSVYVDSLPLEDWTKRVAYDGRRRRQILLCLLVVGLTLAVTSGLIAISQHSRIENVSQEQIPLKVPVEGKSNAKGGLKNSPPSTVDSTDTGSQPDSNTQQAEAGNDASDRQTSARATARASWKKITRATTSRRAHKSKSSGTRARRNRRGH